MELCEAITRVSSIYYHAGAQLRSPLPVIVGALLRERVEPIRGVERRWVDRRHDPKGAFPVDFHVNSIGEPRNIFSVSSAGKAVMVSAVVNFLRAHGHRWPTMTVIDKEAGLGPKDVNRLELASTELRFGIEDHEDDVVQFALNGANRGRKKSRG
jgi:hypothetical protein